jgi:hypothetical protein
LQGVVDFLKNNNVKVVTLSDGLNILNASDNAAVATQPESSVSNGGGGGGGSTGVKNLPPVIDAPDYLSTMVGHAISANVSITDPESWDVLSISTELPQNAVYDRSTGVLTWSPAAPAKTRAVFTVSDGWQSANFTITLEAFQNNNIQSSAPEGTSSNVSQASGSSSVPGSATANNENAGGNVSGGEGHRALALAPLSPNTGGVQIAKAVFPKNQLAATVIPNAAPETPSSPSQPLLAQLIDFVASNIHLMLIGLIPLILGLVLFALIAK